MHEKTVTRTHVGAFISWSARALLCILGWRVVAESPPVKKSVIIAAPQTSAWDFFYGLLGALAMRVPLCFLIKDTVFRWPLNLLLYRLGGIPVNRRERKCAVDQIAGALRRHDRLYVMITPSGTRKRVRYWKTGFYWIAHRAGVPVWLTYIDYRNRVMCGGPFLYPTGDIHADFERIRAFYEPVFGPMPSCRPAPREYEETRERMAS